MKAAGLEQVEELRSIDDIGVVFDAEAEAVLSSPECAVHSIAGHEHAYDPISFEAVQPFANLEIAVASSAAGPTPYDSVGSARFEFRAQAASASEVTAHGRPG